MSEPEISRRCLSCGASIRERAIFCPQCGHSMDAKTRETSENKAIRPLTQTEDENASELSETVADPTPDVSRTVTEPAPLPVSPKPVQRPGGPALEYRSGHRIHRAAAGARDVITDDLRPRVDRLRKISSVVIDQASYDPSLRFVLVAGAMFLIFLIILVVSKIIG